MAETKFKAKAAEYKKKEVKEISKLLKEYPIVGIVNMESLPAAQLVKMRALLREKVVIRMSKKRIMHFAFEEAKSSKDGLEKLQEHFAGMPALLFTKENPFKLYRIIQQKKSKAPAKPGQVAPTDILISAGPTPFAPGPVIGELGQLGIKAGIDSGKVIIKEDRVLVRAGEKINAKVAAMLMRLGIQPMEIGLDLVAVYENKTIFTRDVLAVDEKEFMNKIKTAGMSAINLSVFTAYPTNDTIKLLISKSFNDSKAIALSRDILADAIMNDVIAKAERSAMRIQSKINV